MRFDNPSSFNKASALGMHALGDWPAIQAGIMTFSTALNSGSNLWNWKTKPKLALRKALSAFRDMPEVDTPPMRRFPESGKSRVPRI